MTTPSHVRVLPGAEARARGMARHHYLLAAEADEYAAQAMDEGQAEEAAMWAAEARTRRQDAARWDQR